MARRRFGSRSLAPRSCARRSRGEPLRGDWDIATDARPERVQRLFSRVIPTGIQHGTVTVLLSGQSFEVTTLRGETTYTDGRHPDAVHFVDDIVADLARRDFTINAIAYDPVGNQLIDPFDGLGDLAKRVLRAVGDPAERFAEDGLRVLRAARFVATLDVSLDPGTEEGHPAVSRVVSQGERRTNSRRMDEGDESEPAEPRFRGDERSRAPGSDGSRIARIRRVRAEPVSRIRRLGARDALPRRLSTVADRSRRRPSPRHR